MEGFDKVLVSLVVDFWVGRWSVGFLRMDCKGIVLNMSNVMVLVFICFRVLEGWVELGGLICEEEKENFWLEV